MRRPVSRQRKEKKNPQLAEKEKKRQNPRQFYTKPLPSRRLFCKILSPRAASPTNLPLAAAAAAPLPEKKPDRASPRRAAKRRRAVAAAHGGGERRGGGGGEEAAVGGGGRLRATLVPGRAQGGPPRRLRHAGARRADVPLRLRHPQERAQGAPMPIHPRAPPPWFPPPCLFLPLVVVVRDLICWLCAPAC